MHFLPDDGIRILPTNTTADYSQAGYGQQMPYVREDPGEMQYNPSVPPKHDPSIPHPDRGVQCPWARDDPGVDNTIQ